MVKTEPRTRKVRTLENEIQPPATWPYINDFLAVHMVANIVGMNPSAVYISRPSLLSSTPASNRGRIRRPALESYYRLSVALFARLSVAIDALAKRKGDGDRSVVRSRVVLADLRSFLIAYADGDGSTRDGDAGGCTDASIDNAIAAARSGKGPVIAGVACTIDELKMIDVQASVPTPLQPTMTLTTRTR